MKVAKEKGRELRKTAKRATYAPRHRSERGQEVDSSVPQRPRTSHSVYDQKQLLKKERDVFKLHNIDLEVPRGQLCAIVGPVGAGKSSLVQGMIGGMTLRLEIVKVAYKFTTEMRKTGGEVTFGGSVAYCAQTAWIQVRFLIYVFATSNLRVS
jgi:ABC-type glutathione transport system ATPase component